MLEHLRKAFAEDIRIRHEEEKLDPNGVAVIANEVVNDTMIGIQGVRVTAFAVDHGSNTPAFGYRVEYAGHSVVLSGDTKTSENLVKHAQGADVLIHEVAAEASLRRSGIPEPRVASVVGHHTTPEQAGDIFVRVSPKLAVYSHIVRPDATERELIPPTRLKYSGRLEIGEDLMTIFIGDTIEVRRPEPRSR